jgi:membrane fusion protein
MAEADLGEALAFSVPGWRALAWLAFGAAFLILAFATFAAFDRVANVRGLVVPASGVSRLTAPRTGIVTAVSARQGEGVARGAALITIASSDSLPGGAASRLEMLETYRRQRQLAEAAQETERQRREAERLQQSQQLAELSDTRHSLGAQRALQQERIVNNEQRLRNLAPLRERGYVSDVTYQQQIEAVLALRQQLASLQQQEAQAGHGLEAARLRLAELAAEARRTQLESESSLVALERAGNAARIDAETIIAAPVAGQVASLRAAPGMAVASGEELATLVRPGDRLEVELSVPSASAGSVAPGQEVILRYDAFPYQRYGVGRGTIIEVTATASRERPDATPAYRVKVRLHGGEPFALRPDMTLSASITIERRSLLDWLLAPLRERWRESRRRAT